MSDDYDSHVASRIRFDERLQMLSQRGEAVVHVAADGALGAADDLGDSGIGQVVPDTEDDDGSLLLGQERHRAADHSRRLRRTDSIAGCLDVVGRVILAERSNRQDTTAERRAASVDGDRVEPRPEGPIRVVTVPLEPDGEEDLLEQFLRAMPVADHPAQERHQADSVTAYERLQAVRSPTGDLAHQILVAPFAGCHSLPFRVDVSGMDTLFYALSLLRVEEIR